MKFDFTLKTVFIGKFPHLESRASGRFLLDPRLSSKIYCPVQSSIKGDSIG